MLNAREALGKLDGLRVKYTQIPLLHLEGPAKKLPRRSIHRRLLDRYLFLVSYSFCHIIKSLTYIYCLRLTKNKFLILLMFLTT